MTPKTIKVTITAEDCDIEILKTELIEWYVSNKIGIEYFNISN